MSSAWRVACPEIGRCPASRIGCAMLRPDATRKAGPNQVHEDRLNNWVLAEYNNSLTAGDKLYARCQLSITAIVAMSAAAYSLTKQTLAIADASVIGELISILLGVSVGSSLFYSILFLIRSILPKDFLQLSTTKEWADWQTANQNTEGSTAQVPSELIDLAIEAEDHNNQINRHRQGLYSESVPPMAAAALLLGAQAVVTLLLYR